MKIKSAKKLQSAMSGEDSTIVRITQTDDSWWDVPMDNDNVDLQELQIWAAIDGNTIAEAD